MRHGHRVTENVQDCSAVESIRSKDKIARKFKGSALRLALGKLSVP